MVPAPNIIRGSTVPGGRMAILGAFGFEEISSTEYLSFPFIVGCMW